MRKIKVLTVMLAMALTITGCEKKEEKKEAGSMTKDTTSINSEYIHLTMVSPKTINPINNTNKSVDYVLNLVYDSLFTIDSRYNTVPQLVESYSISGDGRSIEIKLKDVNWHNGSELTAEDVQFTVNLIKNSPSSTYKPFVENISSVSILDNKSLRINFGSAYAFAVDTLIFPIISKSELQNTGSNELNNYRKNMVGTGPYKIAKFNQRSDIILTLNENYYDKDKIKNAKKEINVVMVPDEATQVSMTLALSSDITRVNLSDLSRFHEKEFQITNYEGRGYEYVIFNYNKPFLQNENFRKVISHSVDRKRILDEAYLGNASMVNFPLHSESKYYDKDLKSFDYNIENAKKSLAKIDKIGANDNKETESKSDIDTKDSINKNINETEANLEESNKNNKANYNEKNNVKSKDNIDIKEEIKALNLNIVVNKDNRERVKAAYIIRENLNEIGIKSTIKELEDKELSDCLDKKEYDLALVGWELSSIPDVTEIINYSGYQDEKLTNYLTSLKSSTNETNTKSIYKSIQKYIRDKVAFISLGIIDDYLITNKRIEGDLLPNDFDIYEGIYHVGLEE